MRQYKREPDIVINAVQGRRSLFSVRLRCIRRWVARRLGSTRHERRVMALAVQLFDLTAPRHGLGERERRLLKIGALLHDVGRCRGARRHHVRGAELVLRSTNLPLHPAERSVAAYLTRYHRGHPPELAHDEARDHGSIRVLLAILRAADAMDCRRLAPPSLVIRLRDSRLEVRCHVHEEGCEAACGHKKKFHLLRETLGLTVKMRVGENP